MELIRDEKNGRLVEPGSPQAIAEAIESLATDSALRTALAEQAVRDAVSKFDVDVMFDAYQGIYDRLLTGDRAGRPLS